MNIKQVMVNGLNIENNTQQSNLNEGQKKKK